jgi:hypothetical protein
MPDLDRNPQGPYRQTTNMAARCTITHPLTSESKPQANNYPPQKSAPACLHSTRLFSSTPAPSFTATSAQQSSPFRLSSDKHGSSPAFEGDRYSQYKPKRQWPPDMSKLSPKHQFRLERKYRRRAALKYARPKFIKGVQLAQWGIIGCGYSQINETRIIGLLTRIGTVVVIYAVLFMNWDTKDTPFDGVSTSKVPDQLTGLRTDKYAYRFVKTSSLAFVLCSLHRRLLVLSGLRKGTTHLEGSVEVTVLVWFMLCHIVQYQNRFPIRIFIYCNLPNQVYQLMNHSILISVIDQLS